VRIDSPGRGLRATALADPQPAARRPGVIAAPFAGAELPRQDVDLHGGQVLSL
jgi:hypothetical protein